MSDDLHDIDKLFQGAINDHEQMPPSSVWDGIDKNLDKNNIADIKRKYALLKRIAAVLLLLLTGAGVYMLQSKHTHSNLPGNNTSASNEKSNVVKLPAGTATFNETADKKSNSSLKETAFKNQKPNTDNIEASTGTLVTKFADNKEKGLAEVGSTDSKSLNAKNEKSTETTIITKKYLHKINKPFRQKITITNAVIDEIDNGNTAVYQEIKVDKKRSIKEIENKLELERITGIANEKITTADFMKTKALITAQNIYSPLSGTKTVKQKLNFKTPNQLAFAVTAFFAPGISSFRLEDDHHERDRHEDRDGIKKQEQNQTSTTAGLLVDYNFNKNWSLQSGLTYTAKKIDIDPKKIYADLDNDGSIKYRFNFSSGYTFVTPKTGTAPSVGDSVQTNKSLTSLHYIAIPLSLKYSYSFKKIALFGIAGMSLNILTKGSVATEIADNPYTDKNTTSSINGLKSTYLGGTGGIGIEYNIGKKMALTFMPSYNFAISSITQNSVVKSYPNSLSMAAGLRFKL